MEKNNSIINNHDNSHIVTVSPGPRLLYEAIASSPILSGFESGGGDFGGFGGSGGFGGDLMDPNMDPDLALALRLSLEEEKSRQERDAAEKAKKESELTLIDEGKEDPDKNEEKKDEKKDDDVKMEDAN